MAPHFMSALRVHVSASRVDAGHFVQRPMCPCLGQSRVDAGPEADVSVLRPVLISVDISCILYLELHRSISFVSWEALADSVFSAGVSHTPIGSQLSTGL